MPFQNGLPLIVQQALDTQKSYHERLSAFIKKAHKLVEAEATKQETDIQETFYQHWENFLFGLTTNSPIRFNPHTAAPACQPFVPQIKGLAPLVKPKRVNPANAPSITTPLHHPTKTQALKAPQPAPTTTSSAPKTLPPAPTSLPPKPTRWADVATQPTGSDSTISIGKATKHKTAKLPMPDVTTKDTTRVLLRARPDTPNRATAITALKGVIEKIDTSLNDSIRRIDITRTGFALILTDPKFLDAYRNMANTLTVALAMDVVMHSQQYAYVLKRVPRVLYSLEGTSFDTTISDIITEAHNVTGQQPTWAGWSLHDRDTHADHTLVIRFKEQLPPFQLFGSAPSRPHIPNPKVVQCDACFEFHPTRTCRKQARCIDCGCTRHTGSCTKAKRCVLCLSPDHQPTSLDCPLRPRAHKGKLSHPESDKIKKVRKDNHKVIRQATKATAAAEAASDAPRAEPPNPASTEASSDAATAAPIVSTRMEALSENTTSNNTAQVTDLSSSMEIDPIAPADARTTLPTSTPSKN